MKHILIGTAGHVDHGKTALIRALTGIETDRLAEERSRGITIDLGFAHMTLPGGEIVSIIDVPGHEKFIKNMLAGAGGIDLVLLVIASDDGVMPQTREHLGILQYMKATDGIIVLTKADLTDEDWQDMICEDITVAVGDSFLKDAPIVRVSSHTGQGIQELKSLIAAKIKNAAAKNITVPFRLPVDRVFSAEGFGTVITGTLIEGKLCQGDEVTVYPDSATGRVRSLQVHGGQVEVAYAGQRVAVNISGIRREVILRGHVLAAGGTIQPTPMLDVKLSVLSDSPREIKTGSRLHFHFGTQSALCKAMLIGHDKLIPGQTAYAQLRFAEDIAIKNGDSFVIRFYSPIETVGGGIVLNSAPKKYRRAQSTQVIEALKNLEKGDTGTQIHQTITSLGGTCLPDEIRKRFGFTADIFAKEIDALLTQGRVIEIGRYLMTDSFYASLADKISSQLKAYHQENPLHQGMRKEELRSRVLPGHKSGFFDEILQRFDTLVYVRDGRVSLCGFEITYTSEQRQIRDAMLANLIKGGFTPPTIDDLLNMNDMQKSATRKKDAQAVLDALLAEGAIIVPEPGIIFAAETINHARATLQSLASQGDGTVTLAQFRDGVQTSRKFALSVLEYFDRAGFTRKLGDSRVLL